MLRNDFSIGYSFAYYALQCVFPEQIRFSLSGQIEISDTTLNVFLAAKTEKNITVIYLIHRKQCTSS